MDHFKLTLLISSFVIPLILAITLLVGSKNNLPKLVMGFALLNAFIVFLANYFYFQKLYLPYSRIHSFHIATVLWIFPSIYLYLKAIVSTEKEFRKELVHLLPGLLFGITSAILFYGLLNQEERVFYLSNYRSGIEFSSLSLKIISIFRFTDVLLIVAQVVYYSVVFIRIPSRYHEQLKEEYSNIENFSISWIKWFNVAFVLIGMLSILFYVFNPFQEENDFFLILFFSSISVFMWIIGLWSFKQKKPEIVWDALIAVKAPVFQNANIKEELAKKLIDYFENEKPFLQAELSLTVVCKQVGTNRSYLSAIINTHFGMNFNAFVYEYRTRYILDYLKKHPNTSKNDLVQIAGFGSISSLKRALNKSQIK